MADWRGTSYYQAVYKGTARWGCLWVDLVNAILDELKAADLLAAPRGQQLRDFHVKPCTYVSKACEHKLHAPPDDFCRLTCKFCGSPCQCPDPECRHGAGGTSG